MNLPSDCTIGKGARAACPSCGYIHGDLPICPGCRKGWTPSLMEKRDGVNCPGCRAAGTTTKTRGTGR